MNDTVPHLALLVVDAQPVFLNALPAGGERLVADCRFAVAAARALGIRVIFVEQRPEKLGGTHAEVRAAAPDAPVFAKTAFSAFGAAGLADHLREHDISHLLVCGLETAICIYQTVLAALAEDIAVTLLTDAVAGRREADSEAVLRALQNKSQCLAIPAESVFYAMMGDSTHPAFKAVSALVKDRHR